MGQCYSQVKRNVPRKLAFDGHQGIASNKSTKKTLRGDEDEGGANVQAAIRFNLGDGSDIYRGMRVKGVVEELSQEDLLLAVKSGSSHVVEALCTKYHLTNVCEIRGINGTFEVLRREIYDISNWNLLLIAIAYDHLFAIKLFAVTLKSHLRIALRTPPVSQFSKVQESDPAQAETFSLMLAINNRSESMLKFLWSDLRLMWDSFHFTYVVSELASQRFVDGLRTLLRSQTSHEIYMSMHAQEKLQFLKAALATDKRYQRKWTLEVKECLKEELTGQHPYATVALFVLLNDQSQGTIQAAFNLNRLHLDRSLQFMEATEYARFKHTIKASSTTPQQMTPDNGSYRNRQSTPDVVEEDYQQLVTMRIQEYQQQEESSSQKVFGDKIRHKLEQLDQDVVKLRAPALVSSMDYDQIIGTKIFQLAESGSLREFCDIIDTNDVRLFSKRKRYEITKLLPNNIIGIKRYCYFSPLLVAIQFKQHALVSFIIEKMKLPLRQSLCLFPSDPGSDSSAIDLVSEEYQAYALLVAAANKDEQMLRYLWQCLGGFLWTERHFEPLMRVLIEIQWTVGIRAILQSEMTHDMIRALSSEERAYFVENMIGDLFSFGMGEGMDGGGETSNSSEPPPLGGKIQGQLIVAQTIKEELTRQPYAGLFILYMIDRFEEMSEEDFVYWGNCCQMESDTTQLIETKTLPKRYEDESEEEIKRMAADDDQIEVQPPKYGLYKMELILLSKSNQSRFSQFVLDFGINRKNDRLRQEAIKFIESLRNLPEYKALIEEGAEEGLQNGDEEIRFLKTDLTQAEDILVGQSKLLVELIKYTITGNLKQLQQKCLLKSTDGQDPYQISLLLLQSRGIAIKAYDPSRDHCVLNTREWNPLHYAIYFQQYRTMKYLIEQCGLGFNIQIALSHCRSQNEYLEDKSFDEAVLHKHHSSGAITHQSHIYGLMLSIFAKNLAVLRYLYEESGLQINGIDTDIFPLLKICISSHWPAGFLLIINSKVTARIFTQARLDQKEEFIRFALIECEDLVSQQTGGAKTGVQSQTDEDIVREVKDRMTEHPYSCLSWLFFDTIHKELKNHRYIKRLLESTSFNLEALEILAVANQLEKVIRQCEKPRIQFDFLSSQYGKISNSQEPGTEVDELIEKNRQEDIINQKIHEHKMTYVQKVQEMVSQGGPVAQQILRKGTQYSEICTKIIFEILQKSLVELSPLDRYKNFETLLNIPQSIIQENEISPRKTEGDESWKGPYYKRLTLMLRFVTGFNDTELWLYGEIAAKFPHSEPQNLNLFQWILFYNDHTLLSQILSRTPDLHIPSALSGEHPPLEYQLTQQDGKQVGETLIFEKVGLVLGLVKRSIESIGILMNHSKNLLSSTDVLQFALIIANEQPDLWQGIVKLSNESNKLGQSVDQRTLQSQFYLLMESAFVQTSLKMRSEWLAKLLKCQKSPSFLESIFKNTTQFKYYCQWLVVGSASDDPVSLEIRAGLKKLHGIQLSQMNADYDSQISRFNFLSRGKPKAIVSQLVQQIDDKKNPTNAIAQNNLGNIEPKNVNPDPKSPNKTQTGGNGARLDDFEDKESAEVDSD